MYLVYNGNLLMHGCVPTDEDGTFTRVAVGEELFAGKALYDRLDRLVRDAFWQRDPYSVDYIWYLWCGKNSPVFGRDRMVTYEKHFGDPRAAEKKNPYYTFVKDAAYCERVLGEFGTGGKFAHIVNGHMPVKVKDGEAPESAGGKHITIDGGLAKAYHSKTGIGGYTLISNSQGLSWSATRPLLPQRSISTAWKISTPRAGRCRPMSRAFSCGIRIRERRWRARSKF